MMKTTERIQVTESWSVEVPTEFTLVDNGDSWQAFDQAEQRIVYLGSLIISGPDGCANVEGVTASADENLAAGASVDSQELCLPGLLGRAVIDMTAGTLTGYVAQEGSLLTCFINFDVPAGREWALETWRSIRK